MKQEPLAKNLKIQISNTGEELTIADINSGIVYFTNGSMMGIKDILEQLNTGAYTMPPAFKKLKGPEPMADVYTQENMLAAYMQGILACREGKEPLPESIRRYKILFYTWITNFDKHRKTHWLTQNNNT